MSRHPEEPCARRGCGDQLRAHEHYRGMAEVVVAECSLCPCPAFRRRTVPVWLAASWLARSARRWS